MSRPELLSQDALRHHLVLLPTWESDGTTIRKTFILQTFVAAIGFVNAIAILAETMDHHPDIRIYGWNKVDIAISTHDQGGLTELDMDLASKIDAISL
ncbi:MAG: 4a-hydroxytetrahydrobiopterin dehydratase [Bacteroidota bacterium]|jgi:4a-hydroxytetrahydrobiopterin dehydratase